LTHTQRTPPSGRTIRNSSSKCPECTASSSFARTSSGHSNESSRCKEKGSFSILRATVPVNRFVGAVDLNHFLRRGIHHPNDFMDVIRTCRSRSWLARDASCASRRSVMSQRIIMWRPGRWLADIVLSHRYSRPVRSKELHLPSLTTELKEVLPLSQELPGIQVRTAQRSDLRTTSGEAPRRARAAGFASTHTPRLSSSKIPSRTC